jgi:hypothetical protein
MTNFKEDTALAKKIFKQVKASLPVAATLFNAALKESLPSRDPEIVKANFSRLVEVVQKRAYELYLEAEGQAVSEALKSVISPYLEGSSDEDVFTFLRVHPFVLDRLYLSLTQSRRARAGLTFELVVTTLFKTLGYPHTAQPALAASRPDYVLPNIERYEIYATDCILLTCKRTLRERWRQVVTEGATGQAFFLATIDEKLTKSELARMQNAHVIVVVPEDIWLGKYESYHNVISFERFFKHHLDPAVERWQESGAI